MQPDLFDVANQARGQRLPLPDATVTYYPGWLPAAEADAIQTQLHTELSWQQDTIKLFGKLVKIPRLQAWHGDPGTAYTYSGLTMTPKPWTPTLAGLRDRLAQHCQQPFNSVLANWYRDGNDSMGMHADNEPELGPQPVIGSVTLGQARGFIFRHIHTGLRHKLLLEHGSLLVMAGTTQQFYQHGINKTKQVVNDRINLTFRHIMPPGKAPGVTG